MREGSTRPRVAAIVAKYVTLFVFAALALYPFVWVVITSFKDNFELYSNPFGLPKIYAWHNYIDAWQIANIGVNFFNSLIITAVVMFIVLLSSAMSSYILARVWKSPVVYLFFAVGIMIPYQALLIPTFILVKNLALMNTRIGLILVYAAVNISLAVFLLVGFMRSIPHEIEEAAVIDGAGPGRVFFHVILPLSQPGLATAGTLTLLGAWNEFVYANVLMSITARKTLTQGIAAMQGQYFTNYGMMAAGLMAAIIPVTIIYIAFQENVIRGMSAGAIKG